MPQWTLAEPPHSAGAKLRNELPQRPSLAQKAAVGVVIVNFCQWHNTARLVKQLRQSDLFQSRDAGVVVVDNHSPASALCDKLRRTRGVTVILNDGNDGFAKAVNRGADAIESDWLLLLNPDVTVDEGFLDDVQSLIDTMDDRIGVVGLQLKNSDGTPQASAGAFPTFARTITRLVRPRPSRKCSRLDSRQDVDWATGGGLLVRRDCWQQLHGLSERYFLYYEDVDFCRRARAHGWRVVFDPAVAAVHHSPLHSRRVPAPLRLITRHALLEYARSAWPRWQSRLLGMGLAMEGCVRHLLQPRERVVWRALARLPWTAHTADIHAAARRLSRFAARQDRAEG
jgi:GT2 family glycosyltransferase